MSKREPLLRAQAGKTLCDTVKMPSGKDLKICVRGGKYGFIGELIGKTGQKLPVSCGDARTAREAMAEAKATINRTITRRN